VWEDSEKKTPVVLPRTWHLSNESVPGSLYVEGTGVSSGIRNIELKLQYLKDGRKVHEDKVNVTVIDAEFENVWKRDLDPLNENDNMADYKKCFAVEHQENGEFALENTDDQDNDYIKIQPSGLTFSDVSDYVDLIVAHEFFDSGSMAGIELNYDSDGPGDCNIYAFGLQLKWNANGSILDQLIVVVYSPQTETEYNDWVNSSANPINPEEGEKWAKDLPPPYSSLGEDNTNPEPDEPYLWKNNVSGLPNIDRYHYDARYEMRSEVVEGGHGHQACYYANGDLIEANSNSAPELIAAAGTADRGAPGEGLHMERDVWPFIRAAQLDGNPVERDFWGRLTHHLIIVGENVKAYYKRRPPLTNNPADPPGE
jgi:hypothetical protein